MIDYLLNTSILQKIRNQWLEELFIAQVEYDQLVFCCNRKESQKKLENVNDLEEKLKFLDKYLEKSKLLDLRYKKEVKE